MSFVRRLSSWALRLALGVTAAVIAPSQALGQGPVDVAGPVSSAVTGPAPVDPDVPRSSLTLDEVVAAVRSTHPKAEIADLGVSKAEGKALSARGGWDPELSVGGRWLPLGYYQNGQVDVTVKQATPLWGLGLYGGYRLGLGDFPIYKGEQQTLSGGELRAGVDLPLWKDRAIDERRADIASTEALLEAAQCKRATTDLDLEREAASAYWRWVETGLEVEIQRELLAVAQQRDQALRDQAQLGSVAEIVVLDNARLMVGRQSKLVKARQDFAEAGVKLSLYLRDAEQRPVRPPDARLPARIDGIGDERVNYEVDLAAALGSRPELCDLREQRRAARVQLQLAKNQVAPKINAQAFVSQDLGDGPAQLVPADVGVGITLAMPLGLRKARGKRRSAEAELAATEAEIRGLADAIVAEFQQVLVQLRAAAEQVDLAKRQLELANALAAAEREKFAQGASDLVVINLRETAAADAGRQYIEAQATLQTTWASYRRVTGKGL